MSINKFELTYEEKTSDYNNKIELVVRLETQLSTKDYLDLLGVVKTLNGLVDVYVHNKPVPQKTEKE